MDIDGEFSFHLDRENFGLDCSNEFNPAFRICTFQQRHLTFVGVLIFIGIV